MFTSLAFKRVLLKLSGEALRGNKPTPSVGAWDGTSLSAISQEIQKIHALGVQLAIVVGGGNLVRGEQVTNIGMDRTTGDYMGMLATLINCLALQHALEQNSVPCRVMSALRVDEVAEPYIRNYGIHHLNRGRVVLLAAGTGNPYFTTDTAAALRAIELKTEVLMKATRVNGIYDADPMKNPKAKLFKRLTYMDILRRGLKVMDGTAVSLCMENQLPIFVFNLMEKGNMCRVISGEEVGTLVGELPSVR